MTQAVSNLSEFFYILLAKTAAHDLTLGAWLFSLGSISSFGLIPSYWSLK